VAHEAHQQFVRQARLARPARAGDANDRRLLHVAGDRATQGFAERMRRIVLLQGRNRARDLLLVTRADGPEFERGTLRTTDTRKRTRQ
jgi:hypothetical protein